MGLAWFLVNCASKFKPCMVQKSISQQCIEGEPYTPYTPGHAGTLAYTLLYTSKSGRKLHGPAFCRSITVAAKNVLLCYLAASWAPDCRSHDEFAHGYPSLPYSGHYCNRCIFSQSRNVAPLPTVVKPCLYCARRNSLVDAAAMFDYLTRSRTSTRRAQARDNMGVRNEFKFIFRCFRIMALMRIACIDARNV